MKKIAHFSLLVVLLFGLTACTRNRLREADTTAVSVTTAAPAAATAVTSLVETPATLSENAPEAATAAPTLAPTNSPLPAQPSQAEGLSQDLEETLNQLEQLLDGMDTNVAVP